MSWWHFDSLQKGSDHKLNDLVRTVKETSRKWKIIAIKIEVTVADTIKKQTKDIGVSEARPVSLLIVCSSGP